MTGLLDIPKDIIPNILCPLAVGDLLTLEMTCSFLRDVVTTTRQVWLLELQRLVKAACAPPLPPYVNVDQLGAVEIRSLVVKALRQLKTLKSLEKEDTSKSTIVDKALRGLKTRKSLEKKDDPFSTLDKSTVILDAPSDAVPRRDDWNNLFYRMVPSLKLLIVSDSHLLEIFDIETGTRKWHFTSEYQGVSVKAHGFAYEECTATSLRLFIAGSYDAEKALVLHLFHLEKCVEGDTFTLNVIDAIHDVSICGLDIPKLYIGDICLGGDFAVINDLLGLIIWDWKRNKTTQIIFPLDNEIYDLQIVRDHLFYVLKFMYCRPCQVDIVPLRQFDDAPSRTHYLHSDIKRTFFKPVSLHHNVVRMPRVILYDLRSFGMGDNIRAVTIHHCYLMDHNTAYFPNVFEIDLNTVEEFQDKRCVGSPMEYSSTAAIVDRSAPFGLFVPTLTGSLVVNEGADLVRDDWTFRLRRGAGLHVFAFGEDFSLERVMLPSFLDACDVVLQFESNALIRVFTGNGSGQKRAVIYHLA